MSDLTFDAGSHSYAVDGRPVPGVTDTIGQSFPIWYSDEVAMNRGTAVHRMTECYDRGDPFDGTREEMAIALPYLQQWVRFLAETGCEIDPEWIEQPVVHSLYGYAGTPDRIVTLNGDTVMLDLKTGTFHANHRLQAAAYLMAANQCLGADQVHHSVGVYLTPTGYSLRTWADPVEDFRVFLASLTLANWSAEMNVRTQVPEEGWEPPANNEAFITW